MVKPVKATTVKPEPEAPKKEYKGNDFLTAAQQQGYAEVIERMKADPVFGKPMLSADYQKISAIALFLLAEEKLNGNRRGED